VSAPEVVLAVGSWQSHCGACGRSCDPTEATHVRASGYDQHEGCGATYTHVMAVYPGSEERVREMRPDLIFVGYYSPKIGTS
jgi:hypothetical protein